MKHLATNNDDAYRIFVIPSYDPHCNNGDITESCVPVEVTSVDHLHGYKVSFTKTTKIAMVLPSSNKTDPYVIVEEAGDLV